MIDNAYLLEIIYLLFYALMIISVISLALIMILTYLLSKSVD